MPSINSIAVTSPDISVLGYSVLYDISGATPTIVISNHSTVSDYSNLKFWYTIQMPDGTFLHMGSVGTPDVDGVSWSTITVPDVWPTPFGTPPYSQIEFSCAIPYILTLYVQDSVPNTFQLGSPTTICRPNGNTDATQGNFGVGDVSITTLFESAQIQGIDRTNYTYQNMLGTSSSNKWTLVYPFDNANARPADRTAIDTANVLFPIGYTGNGYQIAFQSYSTYDFGNGSAVKMQYKFVKTFAVWLNIDLRGLRCEMDKLYALSKKTCGTVENPGIMDKITQLNYLYTRVFEGIIYPLQCVVDVPATISEIQRIGGFTCNCYCEQGINVAVAPPASSGGTLQVPIYTIGTTTPPTNCPNSYFPVNVLSPDISEFIGLAYSVDDLVAILNSTASWQVYGIFFAQGNCILGLYPTQLATVVPAVQVVDAFLPLVRDNEQQYILDVVSNCGSGPVTAQSLPFSGGTINFGAGNIALATPINDLAAFIVALSNAANTAGFTNISFSISDIAYPLSIVIENSNVTQSNPTISIGVCPTASAVTENLQQVTTGSGNNITTNTMFVGALGSDYANMSNNAFAINNAGSFIKASLQSNTSGSANGTHGLVVLGYKSAGGTFTTTFRANTATANRILTAPDNSGTIALTTDIPAEGTLQTVTDGVGSNITTNNLVVYQGLQTTTLTPLSVEISNAGGDTDVAKLFNPGGDNGTLELRNVSDLTKASNIMTAPLTADRTLSFPDKDGTLAIFTDIPVGLDGITTGTGNNITGHSIIVKVGTQQTTETQSSFIVSNSTGSTSVAVLNNVSNVGNLFLASTTAASTLVPGPGPGSATTTIPILTGTLALNKAGVETMDGTGAVSVPLGTSFYNTAPVVVGWLGDGGYPKGIITGTITGSNLIVQNFNATTGTLVTTSNASSFYYIIMKAG